MRDDVHALTHTQAHAAHEIYEAEMCGMSASNHVHSTFAHVVLIGARARSFSPSLYSSHFSNSFQFDLALPFCNFSFAASLILWHFVVVLKCSMSQRRVDWPDDGNKRKKTLPICVSNIIIGRKMNDKIDVGQDQSMIYMNA